MSWREFGLCGWCGMFGLINKYDVCELCEQDIESGSGTHSRGDD
jgi:hypothetical protein